MSRYCGVERSTIYKFVSGRREPADREMLDKMAGCMQLTPAEYQELYKAWKIVRMGEATYYTRKSVADFICHFPDRPAVPQMDLTPFAPEKGLSSGRGCIALSSPQAVDQYVSQMIMEEFHRQKGEIGLLMQTDYTYLFRLLASLKPAGGTEISHIVCLENKADSQKDRDYNILACLYEMLPLYMNDLDYRPFYFYDSLESHYHNLSIFPCLVLTAEAVLLCSADFQTGLFFQEEPVVSLFWDRFRDCRDQCMPLLLSSVVTPDNYFSALQVTNNDAEDVTAMIALEPESCMHLFISWELLQEAVNRELPEAEMVVGVAWNTFQLNSRRLSDGKLLVYFTEEGILHFARTGLIEEIPEAFYRPLSAQRRIDILKQLLDCCRQSKGFCFRYQNSKKYRL